MTLGQSQKMTLTLNTHIISFTDYLAYLPAFRSQSAIVSANVCPIEKLE